LVQKQERGRDFFARAAAGTLALIAAAAGIAAVALALGIGDREPLEVRVARVTLAASAAADPDADPLAWDRSQEDEFSERAATGLSHVIYEMSPGGVVASAKRTVAYHDAIVAAAQRHGVDPDTLEALIFLESAGRPNVIAGPTPESASGLAQILPSTATDLLGMSVDLPASIALTRQISHSESPAQTDRLEAARAGVDQRFDPQAAIEGAASYLEIAQRRFGGEDFAVAAYHMGIGNLENVIEAYGGDPRSYAQVYFDSGLDTHRKAYELLSGFGDESADYLWKVLASKEILQRYRDDPEGLQSTAELATNKATMEEVFHPENETRVFEEPDDIADATDDGELLPLPDQPVLGWEPDPDIGELAEAIGQSPDLYRALRPEALATLTYVAGLVRNISGAATPLQVTSAVRDRTYQDLLVQSNPQATTEYSLHTTGWSFDIRRDYESRDQAEAFQYVLDRLRSLALLDYALEPGAIHVTVSDRGAELLSD
jgi:soluble lytic murein transglycosylase-like protein